MKKKLSKILDRVIRFINLQIRYVLAEKISEGRAFLIISQRSTGSRMLKRWFIGNSCEGNFDERQLFSYSNPDPKTTLCVFKTDFNGRWYQGFVTDFEKFVKLFMKLGFRVQIIELVRKEDEMIKSQLRRGHEKNVKSALKYSRKAEKYIRKMNNLFPKIWSVVSYDKFISSKVYRNKLQKKFRLETREKEKYEKKGTKGKLKKEFL